MKCKSCQVEINPQWKHAIDMNVCPFCGKEIMETILKDLLSTLRSTMEQLSGYQDQVDDWMLSNYNYIKTTSKEFSKYLPKQNKKTEVKVEDESVGEEYIVNVQTEEGVEPVVAKKIQSDERTNSFFKRAEVKTTGKGYGATPEKTQHYKSLVKQIREGGTQTIDSSGAASLLSPEMMEQANPEDVRELQAMLEGNDALASSLPDMATGDDDEIPAAVLAMSARAPNTSDKDAKDLARLHQQVNKSQRSSGGSFSRSS
jgi:hypothetical protein